MHLVSRPMYAPCTKPQSVAGPLSLISCACCNTGKVGALRRAADGSPIYIKDVAGLIEALRSFAVNHYLTVGGMVQSRTRLLCFLFSDRHETHCLANAAAWQRTCLSDTWCWG